MDVDDMDIHSIYKTVVNTSLAFGAKRWISTLDRQCEHVASALATNIPPTDFNNLGIYRSPSIYNCLSISLFK